MLPYRLRLVLLCTLLVPLLAGCGGTTMPTPNIPATQTMDAQINALLTDPPGRTTLRPPMPGPSPPVSRPGSAVGPSLDATPTSVEVDPVDHPATPVAGFPLALTGSGPAHFAVTLPPGLLTLAYTYDGPGDLSVYVLGEDLYLDVGCGTGAQVFGVAGGGPRVVLVNRASGPYRLAFGTLARHS